MDLTLRGTVLADGERTYEQIVVRDGLIETDARPPAGAQTIEGWVVPGLVDVHCHIGLGAEGPVDQDAALAQARVDLAAGTLLVRDAGSPVDTTWLQDRDDVPALIRSGKHLARPKRYLRYYAHELQDVAALPEEMGRQARLGDGWVKIVGDWIDRARADEADLEPLWPFDVLAEGVAAAHANGARVTVHTFATETIDDLIAAGVDCLEHGTGMTPEQIRLAAERGIPVVPTLLQVGQFGQIADQGAAKFPRFAARMRQMYEDRYAQVRAFYDAGVSLLVGTDAGGTIAHGQIAAECQEMVRAGIPSEAVLAAASWSARDYLGRPGISTGAPADLVVYPGDPRSDIGVLAHPRAVIRRGQLVD